MCKFMSGYQDKLGNIYDGEGFTDSHSEIALIHGLRDSDVDYYAQNLAKWECTPPVDTTQWKDFSKWKIIADENEAPVWFDVEKIRTHVAKVVGSWFITDKRGVLLGGCYIFDGKESSVKSVIRGRVLAVVNGAYLSGADLSGADLSGAYLSKADLSGADLSRADLSGADLSGAYLSKADLSGANLSRADLSGADLSWADLSGAYLSGANLSEADLSGAYLSRAHLSGAYLSGANLSGADLSGAYLSRAYLSRATVDLPAGWKLENGICTKE